MAIIGKRDVLLSLVKEVAAKNQIDPRVLDAIVVTESTYDPFATRYEHGYKWLETPERFALSLKTSLSFERECQKTSWGLCQVMGGTARWLGLEKPIPTILAPRENLEFACAYIKKLKKKYNVLQDVISAYNAGSVTRLANGDYENQDYVDKVIKTIQRLTL